MRMSLQRARARFAAARIASLATADPAGVPHLVPVTFALVTRGEPGAGEDVLGFAVDHKPKATTRLRRLRNIERNPAVALLVDHYDDEAWARLWWARADGHASVVEAAAADDRYARVRDALAAKYPQYAATPPAGPVVWIQVTGWSGWAAAPAAEHPQGGDR